MQTLLSVLGFAVMIGLAWGAHALVSRGSAAVSDLATGNSKSRSQAATSGKISFNAPVTTAELMSRIRSNVNGGGSGLRSRSSAVDGGGALMIEKPGLGAPNMAFLVNAVDEEGGSGCKGYATVQSWREAQGRVDSVKAIEVAQEYVREAVRHFGGSVSES